MPVRRSPFSQGGVPQRAATPTNNWWDDSVDQDLLGLLTGGTPQPMTEREASQRPPTTPVETEREISGIISKIARDAPALSTEEINKEIEELLAIGRGEEPPSGFEKFIQDVGSAVEPFVSPVFENVIAKPYNYTFGQLSRGVQGLAKEVSDVLREDEEASFDDWVGYWTGEKELTYPGWDNFVDRLIGDRKIFIGERGETTFGQVANFAANVPEETLRAIAKSAPYAVADPLTYVTFGSGAYTQGVGRAALASRLARSDAQKLVPSLSTKIGRIAREGEFALTASERQILTQAGIMEPAGVRFMGRPIVGTGRVQQAVGGTATRTRARVGDVAERVRLPGPVAQKTGLHGNLLDLVTPESLTDFSGLFRGRVSGREALVRAAQYGSARQAKSAGTRFVEQQGYDAYDLMDELLSSPDNNVLYEFIENPAALNDPDSIIFSLPAASQDLGNRLAAKFGEIRDAANQVVQEFAAKRGLRASGIGDIDDYFFHTLTDDAGRWVRNTRNAKGPQSKVWSGVQDQLDISIADLRAGSAPVRHRTLKKDAEFLGEVMRADGISEANRISRQVLGFDWFETDAASVLNSYIESVGRQVKRIEYFDNLFQYGPEFIRPVLQEMVPDKELQALVQASVDRYDELIATIGRRLSGDVNATVKNLNAVKRGTQKILDDQDRLNARTIARLSDLESQFKDLEKKIEAGAKAAKAKGQQYEEAFDLFMRPVTDRLQSLNAAIATGEGQSEMARQWLLAQHTKLFPKRKNRPVTPRALAREIAGEKKRIIERRIKALETRRARAKRAAGPESGAAKTRARAEAKVEALAEPLEQLSARVERLKVFADDMVQSDIFPEGVIYTTDDQLAGGIAFVSADASEIPGGAGVVALPAPTPQDIFDLVDDINAWRVVSANTPDELGDLVLQLTNDQALANEFVDEALRLFRGGRGGAPTPTFPDEVADLLRLVDGSARMKDVDQDTVLIMFEGMAEQLSRISQVYGAGPIPNETAFDMVRDAFVRSMPVPEGPYAVAIIPDPVDGWVAVLPNEPMAMHNPRAAVEARVVRETDDIWEDVAGPSVFDAVDQAEAQASAMQSQRASASRTAIEAERKMVEAKETAAKTGRQIGAQKRSITQAERQATEQAERAAEKQLVTVDGDTLPLSKVRSITKEEQRKYNKAKKGLADAIDNDPVNRTLRKDRKDLNTVAKNLDTARIQQVDNDFFETYLRADFEDDVNKLIYLVKESPPRGAAADEFNRWLKKIERSKDYIGIYPEQREVLDRLLTQLWSQEAELAALESSRAVQADLAQQVADGMAGGKLADVIEEGWVGIGNLGVQIPQDVWEDMVRGVEKLRTAQGYAGFLEAYFAYQRFFKAYAISTPGFTVRNAITAALNNVIAPMVSVKDQLDGIRFAKRMFATRRGTIGSFDRAVAGLSREEQAIHRVAYDMYLTTGGGQALDDALPIAKGAGSRAYNNAYTRGFRGANEGVEMAARMGMALGAARSGMDINQGAALIARWHFDYTDLSKLDRIAKTVIPFWTFASRNVPLQFVNQYTRPGVYRFYERMRENDAGEVDPDAMRWLRDRNPLVIGENLYLNYDLPWVQLEEQAAQLADPVRLLGQSNPLIRSAIEGLTGESLAFGTPFSEQKVEARGADIPAAVLADLAELIGIGEGTVSGPEGEQLISSLWQNFLPGILPPLQQAQRIITPMLPEGAQEAVGGPVRYQQRDIPTTVGGYLGLPAVQPTESQLSGEQRRRIYSARDILDDLRKRGIIE